MNAVRLAALLSIALTTAMIAIDAAGAASII
jgi:hypothetical protein